MCRLEILSEIDKVYDANCESCPLKNETNRDVCEVCPAGIALEKLGDKLLQERRKKIDVILAKGLDMTRSDIQHLLNKGIARTEIMKSLGVGRKKFSEITDGI